MNEDGFVFTVDSVLMLIPVFIILATVSGISFNVPHKSPYYAAQDAMSAMLLIATDPTDSSLNSVARNISNGNPTGANTSALRTILNSYNLNYNLTYYNAGSFVTLIHNGTMSTANTTISTSTRTHLNVTFRLFMWR